MPGIPQYPVLPSPAPNEALGPYAARLVSALQRAFTTTNYTLNGTIRVDTSANQPATPEQNESFYYASDTGELFIAVGGAWVSLEPAAPTDRVLMQFSGVAVLPATTVFLAHSAIATEGAAQFASPVTGTLSAIYVACSTAPTAGQTFTYRVRINGANVTGLVTVSDAETSGNQTGLSTAITAGDLVTQRLITSAGAAVANHHVTWAIVATG